MKLAKTVKCKLQVDDETRGIFLETLDQFAACCNDYLAVANETKDYNHYRLRNLRYHAMRAKYTLQADFISCAAARVVTACVVARKNGLPPPKVFRPTSADLTDNSFTLLLDTEEVTIASCAKRQRASLVLGNYQYNLLQGQKPTSATLVYDSKKKVFYIHITVSTNVVLPDTGKPVGIDRGLYNVATTSNGLNFSGRQIMDKRRRYAETRRKLQAKGTKSAKRRLKKLSGKEHAWMKDINHQISKRIVERCEPGDMIVMEDLTHIRDRIKSRKDHRIQFHSWAFAQLQQFITYKANHKGIPVVTVNPRYTSQKCSKCGEIGIRKKHQFWCPYCDLVNNADFNAAYNIRKASMALSDGLPSTSPDIASTV